MSADPATDYYELTMRSNAVEILPGLKTELWAYDGIPAGPTIVATRGRPAVVRHVNALPATHPTLGYPSTASVHLHGSASLPEYDGYASDVTKPGQYKDYHYPNFQDARTLWYHDHGVHHTAENAYMGLAAVYILHDDLELSLPIPHGRYDVPLIVRDAMFAPDGNLIYDDNSHSGLFGDVILVNGRPWPRMEVERRKYRFRVLNASISRAYRWALDTGDAFTAIGTDGGLMQAPQRVTRMRHGQAERYEIVIDFAKYPVDQSNNAIPDVLNPKAPAMDLTPASARRTRRFEFIRKDGHWTVNGKTWADVIASDYQYVWANPGVGDIEIWEFVNSSGGWYHPIHVHLVDYKVLDRNGKPPFPHELGPKDVVYCGEDETVRVIAQFGPHQGRYMMHCHNLVHEDHDMMAQFQVGPAGSGDDPIWADVARDMPAPAL